MSKSIVGLKMLSRGIIAAEVATGKRPKLRRVGVYDLPEGSVSDGEVINQAAVTRALQELWREAKFSTKRVVWGVGNQRVLVRNHTVPQLSRANLGRALRYQVRDMLPVPVNDTILDFYPIEPVSDSAPPQMAGLLIAAMRDMVETGVDTITDAGLKVVGVDLAPFALARALDVGDALSNGGIIVGVGERATYVVIVRDRVPRFVRIVPLGSEHLVDALVSAKNVGRGEAIALCTEIGFEGGEDPEHQAIARMLTRAAEPLFEQLRSTFLYYQSNFPATEFNGVTVTGNSTRMTGFLESVERTFGLPVNYGDPLGAVDISAVENSGLLKAVGMSLAIPIGLALGKV